ncbi:MAG: hypothetical protein M1469_06160 [Bacteroidetes bacterium]|nr:hypothetical protein [Bacteroidota bacterium]
MISVSKPRKSRIFQGDIFKDVEYIEYVREKSGILEVSKINFPLVIVLSQDCDLEQDAHLRDLKEQKSTQDKWLLSVLVAPLYNAEHVYQGEHLSELDLRMQQINKNRTPGTTLRNNETPRYHYLEFPSPIPIVPSVIDFKHYFAVNVKYLSSIRRKNFICSVSPLFREDISLRFANYLARIGLPEKKRRQPRRTV